MSNTEFLLRGIYTFVGGGLLLTGVITASDALKNKEYDRLASGAGVALAGTVVYVGGTVLTEK